MGSFIGAEHIIEKRHERMQWVPYYQYGSIKISDLRTKIRKKKNFKGVFEQNVIGEKLQNSEISRMICKEKVANQCQK